MFPRATKMTLQTLMYEARFLHRYLLPPPLSLPHPPWQPRLPARVKKPKIIKMQENVPQGPTMTLKPPLQVTVSHHPYFPPFPTPTAPPAKTSKRVPEKFIFALSSTFARDLLKNYKMDVTSHFEDERVLQFGIEDFLYDVLFYFQKIEYNFFFLKLLYFLS